MALSISFLLTVFFKQCCFNPHSTQTFYSYLQTESTGPYLSLVVVTKHDTNPGLFNTKFRLNFHSRLEAAQNAFADNQEENVITIGELISLLFVWGIKFCVVMVLARCLTANVFMFIYYVNNDSYLFIPS